MDIGIVGLGGMGRVYWRVFERIDGARVTAVVSSSISETEAAKRGAQAFRSIKELLQGARPELCCVCTPSYLHFEHIYELLEAGVPVISEKPLAMSAAQAETLFALAQKNGVRLYTAQVVRFAFPTKILRALVCGGKYGRVLDASFSRLSAKPIWSAGNWVFDKKVSGFVPYELHLHDLDLIVSLFGLPKEARMIGLGSNEHGYQEHCGFMYKYDGFMVRAEASWFDEDIPFTVEWRVCFERAVAECRGETVTLYARGKAPEVFTPPDRGLAQSTGINVPATDMYHDELVHFLDCAKRGADSDIVVSGEVIEVIRILEDMTQNADA